MRQKLESELQDNNSNFLSRRCCKDILINEQNYTKKEIVEKVRNLYDELDRFCP